MDRLTVAGSGAFRPAAGSDYLENNCVEEPVKLCEFRKVTGRILKTVDSVYQEVGSADECRELCLNSPYRCHSYDYGDTGDLVCRLSHHSRATLADIQVSVHIHPTHPAPPATRSKASILDRVGGRGLSPAGLMPRFNCWFDWTHSTWFDC